MFGFNNFNFNDPNFNPDQSIFHFGIFNASKQLTDGSKKSKAEFDFGKCKVCKDKATGNHYGIPTCEACKGFFKRSIQNHHKYSCFFDYKCQVTPKARKRCKYCRWKSCLEAGMSYKGIKMGRIPKIDRERGSFIKEDDTSSDDTDDETNVQNSLSVLNQQNQYEKFDLSECLKSLLNSDSSLNLLSSIDPNYLIPNTSFTDLCLKTSNEQYIMLLSLVKDKCYQLFLDSTQEYRLCYAHALRFVQKGVTCDIFRYNAIQTLDDVWEAFSKDIRDFTISLINTVSIFPGFDNFDLNDVCVIVNERSLPVLSLAMTRLFINGELYLMIERKIRISRYWMEKVLGYETTVKIFKFHEKLNSFNLSDHELAILVPWMLCSEDIEVKNKKLLRDLRFFYSKVLVYELSLNQRPAEFYNKLAQFLKITPEINRTVKSVRYEKIDENKT